MNTLKSSISSLKYSYKKVFTSIFSYGIFVFGIVVAFFIARANIYSEYKSSAFLSTLDETISLKRTKLIIDFNNFLDQSLENKEISVVILKGELGTKNNFIESYNNLLTYKGFVIPRNLYLHNTFPLKNISQFHSKEYPVEDLDIFINNMIATKDKPLKQVAKRPQLPLNTDVTTTFTLSCLFQNKIANSICNSYTKKFIDNFFVYTLPLDYNGFKLAFNKLITKDQFKKPLCSSLKKYVLYSNDISPQLSELFASCGGDYPDRFLKFGFFIDIEKQLDNKYLSKDTYNDPIINAYKLISFQQILFEDILNNKIYTDRISSYFDFLEEIIKKDHIDGFYLDLTYHFNTTYLKKKLEDPLVYLKNKSAIDILIKKMNTLHKGDTVLGVAGLETQLTNTVLMPQDILHGSSSEKYSPGYYADIDKIVDSIPFLNIIQKNISGNLISLKGIFTLELFEQKKFINIEMDLNYADGILYVNTIHFPDYPQLTKIFSDLLTTQTIRVSQLLYYLSKNFLLYDTYNSFTLNIKNLCEEIQGALKKDIELNVCNENQIAIKKNINSTTITYKIIHNNFVIKNINISDPTLQKQIVSYLNDIDNLATNNQDISQISFVNQLISIINYEPLKTKNPDEKEGSSNSIIAIEQFNKYFNIPLKDIIESDDDKFFISFTLGGIEFLGYYNINTNILGPLYFAKVLDTNTLPYLIKNFSLSLDDENKTTISLFVLDPLNMIKQANPNAYDAYQTFIKQ